MGMIQVHCNDCHTEISLATYLTPESFVGTAYEKEALSYSKEEFYDWIDKLYRSGRLRDSLNDDEISDLYYLDGNVIMSEATRWEMNPVCPECGSKNVYTF